MASLDLAIVDAHRGQDLPVGHNLRPNRVDLKQGPGHDGLADDLLVGNVIEEAGEQDRTFVVEHAQRVELAACAELDDPGTINVVWVRIRMDDAVVVGELDASGQVVKRHELMVVFLGPRFILAV